LLIPNRKMKKMANIVLLLTKLLNLYSHFAIEDLFERMAPTLVFFFMLICRMVVDWQFDKTLAAEKVTFKHFYQIIFILLFLRLKLWKLKAVMTKLR
jgi:hypothetical protein